MAGDPVWSIPYPIVPCRTLMWGDDGGVVHFSAGVPSQEASAFVYGVMTWVFYGAKAATLFSIEKTLFPDPWLNVYTSYPDDWEALDAVHARLLRAGTNIFKEVYAICDEVRS